MKAYRIRDWHLHYENNRTKEMAVMRWVPMPNKHDGYGYSRMVEGQDGPAIFAAWCACVQVASKCHPRGTLLRNSGTLLRAHDAASLSSITRLPSDCFVKMLQRACDPDIGWIEEIEVDVNEALTTIPHPPAEIPHPPAPRARAREGNRREGNIDSQYPRPLDVNEVIQEGKRIMCPEGECRKFYDHYEACGWVMGPGNPVRNWRAALGKWKSNASNFAPRVAAQGPPVRRNAFTGEPLP